MYCLLSFRPDAMSIKAAFVPAVVRQELAVVECVNAIVPKHHASMGAALMLFWQG